MSALSISIRRKRHHFPDFRDSSDSDSEDFPPRKKRKDGEIPLIFKNKLQRLSDWFWEIKSIHKVARMALRCGASLPPVRNPKEYENNSDEDDDEPEIIEEEEEDDDDIQEIKENVKKEKLSPLVKEFGKPQFSINSERSKQLAVNGSNSFGSLYNSSKVNGTSARELRTRCHGTTNCNLRREQTEKLKRQPLISNPPSEVEIILGNDPEVVTFEGNGIEIVSESQSSKQKSASIFSEKSFQSSVKSISSKTISLPHKQRQPSTAKSSYSSSSRSYTANEVVRLQEKEQYKLLLEKYSSSPLYHYVCKKPQSDEHVKEDSGLFSGSHFKKQVLEQPIDSFIAKYYTPCRLLPSKAEESSEKKKEPPETVTLDEDEDDDIQIVDMKLPQYKAVFQSKLFTKDWLAELGKHVEAQTEETNKIIEDYERRLEKCKKERLLRRLRVDVPAGKAVEPEFPELTPEMEDTVDNIWHTGGPEDVLCKTVNNNMLLRKDFETLQGLHWLNDTIINSYFDLIMERSKKEGYPSVYAFNTFFYGTLKSKGYSAVRRWTRKIDIFSFDINFVPIHVTFHWCLAVIDHRSKKISYYDSMGTSNEDCLDYLYQYLDHEYKDKKGQVLDPSTYVTETMKDIPQQMNGSDCGMFTLKYAEYISRNAEITFDQQHMAYFRRRTVYELLTNQLL